jgi:transcription initiation factor TFIIB
LGPIGLAASVLDIACKGIAENITQPDMAKMAGVTEVTIRNRVRDLGKSLNLPDQRFEHSEPGHSIPLAGVG